MGRGKVMVGRNCVIRDSDKVHEKEEKEIEGRSDEGRFKKEGRKRGGQ